MKFSEIGLHPTVMAGVEANGYTDCTPIQEAAFPHILSGRDVAGLAQTGTGKTAAFVLPIVDRIVRSREVAKDPSVVVPEDRPVFQGWRPTNFILVLVPTRELAEQVYEAVAKFGKGADVTATSIYGGTGYEAQKAAIKSGVDFIVATPGRLIDLYKEHQLDLNQVRAIVFDEADRMFDMGFKDDMKYILRRVPQDRQFLVFSATLNFDVLNTAYEFGANPVEINVSRDQAKAENVVDEIMHVGHFEKPQFLLSVLQKQAPKQAIIFSNFKHNVERIAKFLSNNGVPAMGISSLISQSQRTRIMELFRTENNDRNVLVATDVAARGLDIKGVDLVINFELPDDAENYVHRIGRTGRAGASGRAISLVGDRDVEALQRIETYLGHKVNVYWLDDADILKEFKEFPRDEGRREFKSHDGGGHRGGGDRRPQSPRHHRGGDRPHSPRHGGGGDRPHGDRPQHQRSDRPHGERPQGQQGDRPQGQHGRPQHHRDRPQGQHGRPQHQRNDRPQQGDRNQQNGSRPQHHRPHQRHDNRGPNQQRGGGAYKYKPDQKPISAAGASKPGMMSSVTGFFKKLFGG